MYIVTKTAAWWEEPAAPEAGPGAAPCRGEIAEALRARLAPSVPDEGQRIVRWAARGWETPRGKCLALRFEGRGGPQVLVRGRGTRQWLPLSRVLDGRQAWEWARTGFVRLR